MLDNKIHVALAVYDKDGTYSQHAGVVAASIFEHTSSPVVVHLLHDDTLTQANRDKFIKLAGKYGQTIEFIDVSEKVKALGNFTLEVSGRTRFSRGALFRLVLPDVLDLDKIIYLDTDLVVMLDIKSLWEEQIDGKIFGGILEATGCFSGKVSSRLADRLYAKSIGYDQAGYINSGVLLINLKRLRATCDLAAETFKWFERYGHLTKFPDENFINSRFADEIKHIDAKYNKFASFADGDPDGKIIHFTGTSAKPWREIGSSPYDYLYWQTFFKTPWSSIDLNNTPARDMIKIMLDLASASPWTHKRALQCLRRVLPAIRDKIANTTPVMLAGILFKEARYRLTHKKGGVK